MTNIAKDILSTYGKVEQRVSDFLDSIATDIQNRDIEYTEYTKMILTLLVSQLVLYYKALDEIKKADSVETKDDYKRKAKAPSIAIMQKANDQILRLMDKIGLSPIESSKIKRLNSNSEESATDLLATLIS